MMRYWIAGAAALGACGGVAWTQTVAPSWSGHYEGKYGEGKGSVTIKPADASGVHAVEVDVTYPTGCSGSVSALARPQGDKLVLLPKKYMERGQCRITLTRTGGALRVGEENCGAYHGMSCEFNFTVRRGSAATARTPARAPTPASQMSGTSAIRDLRMLSASGGIAGGGHAAPAPTPARAIAMPTAEWLAGNWVARGGYCYKATLRLMASGQFGAQGAEGRWALTRDKLILESWPVDSETGKQSGTAAREILTISRTGPNDMLWRGAPMKRCPTKRSVEPWHPDVPFFGE
jgi:hypothetical protein